MTPARLEAVPDERAFRHLAALAGRPLREVVRSLPPMAWNYEA